MSRKFQQQFLFSKVRNDLNRRGQFPIKITQKNIEKVNINLNLNNSYTKDFNNMQKENNIIEDDDSNNLLAQSYSFNQINKYREKILNEPATIILESKIYSKENGGKKNYRRKNKFITPQDASGLFEKILNQNKEEKEDYLKLRNIFLNENEIKIFFKNKLNQSNLQKLHSTISNLNYSINLYLTSNNVNPLISLKQLFEEMNLTNINNIRLNYNEKYNKLSQIIYRCRKIKGDGNCYYRAVMFRYFEQIILNKNLILLKKIILEMNQAFKSKEIQDRLNITMNVTFKPDLHLNIMLIILNLLEEGKIKESYELFIKCILSCAVFDYGLILYFRYILYLYIKDNEKKLYSKNFPVKVGNFLPSKYENENGEFEFQKFYTNYLLKMHTEAEKIIIYLTPFVLGINLDIIIFEDNESQIIKRFSYEEENGDNKLKDNAITLLNRNAHYELVYTYNEYNKFSEFYKNCEIFEENKDENILGNSLGDSNFFLFQSNNFEYKKNKENKTMILQPKNNNNKNLFNNNAKIKTIVFQKKHINISNIHSNNRYNNNGSQIKQNNNPIKIINENNKSNNLNNKDNNNDIKDISKEEIKPIVIESNNKQKIKVKNENEIPFGHPEYKSDNFDSYLDEIDNMFLNNVKFIECLKCKKKVADSIQTDYEFCDECLKNEVINLLVIDYSNYLKTNNIKIKNYKISKSIKLHKNELYLKNIIDILRQYINISTEDELYQYIKQFACLYCRKKIDTKNNSKVKFPCGCAVCNKDELEKFFTEQNILSENYQCLCEYKYQPKDFYALAEECKKAGSECICLLIINIFHKDILSKGCCGCGSKQKDMKIKYQIEKNNKNEFFFEDYYLNSLVHFFCKNCDKRLKNQKFICHYCNKIHLYLMKE